ncbi:prolyl endopeptidase-like protein [Tanacetum coccineum]|uniref:Prolyl endopeptidase-like protein n=1 Tax=Tanacetum coccineum TaxID=301880 RepID=A0ABQ5IVQ2_9ASTR
MLCLHSSDHTKANKNRGEELENRSVELIPRFAEAATEMREMKSEWKGLKIQSLVLKGRNVLGGCRTCDRQNESLGFDMEEIRSKSVCGKVHRSFSVSRLYLTYPSMTMQRQLEAHQNSERALKQSQLIKDLDSEGVKEFVKKQVELTELVIKKCEARETLHDKLTKFYDYSKFGAPFREAGNHKNIFTDARLPG